MWGKSHWLYNGQILKILHNEPSFENLEVIASTSFAGATKKNSFEVCINFFNISLTASRDAFYSKCSSSYLGICIITSIIFLSSIRHFIELKQ